MLARSRCFVAFALALTVGGATSGIRIGRAKWRSKRLSDFDLSATPSINAATVAMLASGAYLDTGDPVVFLGDSGTGKSHLLIGLGMAACEQGKAVAI